MLYDLNASDSDDDDHEAPQLQQDKVVVLLSSGDEGTTEEDADAVLARRLQAEEYGEVPSTALDAAASSESTLQRREFPAETSCYTKALDTALALAATTKAADGAALFEEEAPLLHELRALDAAHRQVIARLIFVQGPWHRWGGRSGVSKYAPANAAHAAVEALVRAGALVRFTASSTRAEALELLPCLVSDELRAIRKAVKEAAQAAAANEAAGARASGEKRKRGEGKLRALTEDEKGDSSEAMLSRIRGFATSYPTVPLERIMAGVLSGAASSATPRPPACDEEGKAGANGDETCVRVAPAAERLVLRAMRLAERVTVPARLRPAPSTMEMRATLRAKPPRKSSAPSTATRPLFASRQHWQLTEAAIELGVAVRCAHVAGAEGQEMPSQREWATRQRKLARSEYAVCNVPAALAELRTALLRERDANAEAAPNDVDESIPLLLPECPAEASAIARTLADATVPLLEAHAQTPNAEHMSTLPPFARRFEIGPLLAGAAFTGVRLIERAAETARKSERRDMARAEYALALERLDILLRCSRVAGGGSAAAAGGGPTADTSDTIAFHAPDPSGLGGGVQESAIYADDGGEILGRCHVRKLIDLKALHGLGEYGEEQAEEAIATALKAAKDDLPHGSAARWDVEASAGDSWRAPKPQTVIRQPVAGRVGQLGSRLLFESNDGGTKLVEHRVGELLHEEDEGGWTYRHDEGGDLRQLFGVLLHEQIFEPDVPDAFYTACQGMPLDMHSPHFYEARKNTIDSRLEELAAATPTCLAQLVREAFDAHHSKCSAFVRWGEDRWAHMISLQKVAVCFGGVALAGIFLHMARTGIFGGMPDLTLIKASRPNGAGGFEKVSTVKQEAVAGMEQDSWPLQECGGGDGVVRIKLAQVQLPICTDGILQLGDGAPLTIKTEFNMFAPGRKALAVHLATCGAKCGYVQNVDIRAVRPGAATAVLGEDGEWWVDAPEAAGLTIEIGDDWLLHGAIVEVKSKKDSLWTEQRMWLRALLEPEYTSHYGNPYLFDAHGTPSVNISICKVTDPQSGAAANGVVEEASSSTGGASSSSSSRKISGGSSRRGCHGGAGADGGSVRRARKKGVSTKKAEATKVEESGPGSQDVPIEISDDDEGAVESQSQALCALSATSKGKRPAAAPTDAPQTRKRRAGTRVHESDEASAVDDEDLEVVYCG